MNEHTFLNFVAQSNERGELAQVTNDLVEFER